MSAPTKTHVPACPFCGSAWTAGMMTQYDAMSASGGCACCGDHAPQHEAVAPTPRPIADLSCSSCGRVIYEAPPVS